uniref:Methuselah N-terminal domain-containing protein n=1 Tax=Anopheles atroparvus TaxID=41427 RepID=A0A182JHB4_ANOAO
MVVWRNANGPSRWPLVLWCALVCALLVTAASAYEASGQGESTYEEYDDEGPYHRPFELPDTPDDDGLEDFEDHGPVDEVLDPITDDDISYSGYYDEDGLDMASAGPVHEGNVSSFRSETHVSVSDDPHAPDHSTVVSVRESAASVTETSVNPTAQTLSAVRVDAGVSLSTGNDGNATTLAGAEGLQTTTVATVNVTSCAGHQKLSEQPVYIGPSVNFIRKCCPHGQRLVHERSILVSCRKESEIVDSFDDFPYPVRDDSHNGTTMSGIVATFYDGCIEDLEEDVLLGFSFGNPCSSERGLVSFGARTNDTLYVIQNGSLLVIYGVVEDYDIFDTYCLDYDSGDGSLLAYVCPVEVEVQKDVIAGMLVILNICLVFAIPLLLTTAALYMIIPDLHDLHGRALAMNCVNFAIALLLECFFQHKTRGKRMNGDELVLENYAEYFILATFFWLLVNCANNCFYAWNNYTTLLFAMMAAVWIVMTVTYYTTYELPIFYDILFGLQGILMFIIFVCMPRPLRTVQQWFKENNYCGCRVQSEGSASQENGAPAIPLMATRCIIPTPSAGLELERLKDTKINNPLKYLPE